MIGDVATSKWTGRRRARGPETSGRGRRWLSLAFMCLSVLVIVLDGSIVNVALPTLAVKLPQAANSGLQWIVNSYILAFSTFLLTAGTAADRLGRRRVLLIGLGVFAAVSLGAAWSTSCGALIAWRIAMGLAASLIFPSTLAIIAEDFPETSERKTAIAIWAGTSGLGVAIGPVSGGWLLEHWSWGSIFIINVPVAVVAMLGVRLFSIESRDAHRKAFDPVGCSLAATGIFALVWGIIEAPERGWRSAVTLAALGSGVGLLFVFMSWERRARSPMLDVRYFLDRRFSAACAGIAAAFFGLFGFVFLVTQYFQFVLGYSALGAGLRTTPFAGFILLGALIAASLGRRIGARVLSGSGLAVMAAGFAWAANQSIDTPYAFMVAEMALLGTGLGLVNAAATEVIMSAVSIDNAGTGSSVNDTVREVGGTLGVAAMGSAFNALYRVHLDRELAPISMPPHAKELVRSSIGAANEVIARVNELAGPAIGNALRAPVHAAFFQGFSAGCWIASAVALIGAVTLALIPGQRSAKYAEKSLEPVVSAGR